MVYFPIPCGFQTFDTHLAPYRKSDIQEYRQDAVQPSTYQRQLDEEADEDESSDQDADMRYWSDFNRVYYHPGTIQKLPDPMEWENVQDDWSHGQEILDRHEEVSLV
jgi:hypothetical protein